MQTTSEIQVLDPTVEPDVQSSFLANRPESLDGSVIGLLANGKKNSEELLQYVCDTLSETFDIERSIAGNKGNASRPCPPDLLEERSESCDVIITASGD